MPGLLSPVAGRPYGGLPYNELLGKLIEASPVPVSVKVEPGYRGPRNWTDRQYQCIFGGVSSPGHKIPPNDTSITPDDWATLVISRPFNILTVHAWNRADSPVVTDRKMLEDAVVAVDEVLSLDLGLHARADIAGSRMVKVKNPWEALDLLQAGRVNFAYAFDNDVELYRRRHPGIGIGADRNLKLLVLEESMMCWPGEGAETFISYIDARLKALDASGELARLTLKDRARPGADASP